MIDEIVTIVGKEKQAAIVAGHKLIEAQLEYVFEEDGKLYRTTVPLIRDGSVLVIVLPPGTNFVGIPEGEIVVGYKPEQVPA